MSNSPDTALAVGAETSQWLSTQTCDSIFSQTFAFQKLPTSPESVEYLLPDLLVLSVGKLAERGCMLSHEARGAWSSLPCKCRQVMPRNGSDLSAWGVFINASQFPASEVDRQISETWREAGSFDTSMVQLITP